MTFRLQSVCASLLALGFSMATSACLAAPSLSIPSTPDVDGKVQISGSELPALTQVTVRFAHESMAPIDLVAQVGSNGSFAIKFAPPIVGAYAVTVYDSAGRQIGQGQFGFFR